MINVDTNSLPGLPVGAVGVHAGQVRGKSFCSSSFAINSSQQSINTSQQFFTKCVILERIFQLLNKASDSM